MYANKTKYLIILAGPTAVGKTEVSLSLGKMLNAEIFSCDSRQVYNEMNIGTAKPTEQELMQVKHHFIGTKSINETYTAGDYEREVDLAFAEYFKYKDIAIMTGGTGLYINAVTKGLDEFPEPDPMLLTQLNEKAENNELNSLLSQLQKLDPTTYQVIDKSNSRRVVRALSVCMAEGKPYSSYLRKEEKQLNYTPVYIVLTREREELYARINQRVDNMMEAGLLEEVKSLHKYRDKKALQTVGYTELFKHIDGELTLSEAVSLIKRNSRRYAKRQMTWFRNQGDYKSISAYDFSSLEDYIKDTLSINES